MSGLERKWVLSACAHLCSQVCLKCRVYMPLGASFLGDVPLVEYMYLVFTRMPGERYRSRLRSLFHVTKSNKRTEESFSLKVRHFVWPFNRPFHQSALIGLQSVPRAFRSRFANVEHVKFCNCFRPRASGSTGRKIWGHATRCNFNLTRISHQRKHRMVLTLDFRLEPVLSDDGSVPKATLENSQYTMYRVMVYLSLIYLLHSGRPVGLWFTSQLPTSQWTTYRAMVHLSSDDLWGYCQPLSYSPHSEGPVTRNRTKYEISTDQWMPVSLFTTDRRPCTFGEHLGGGGGGTCNWKYQGGKYTL